MYKEQQNILLGQTLMWSYLQRAGLVFVDGSIPLSTLERSYGPFVSVPFNFAVLFACLLIFSMSVQVMKMSEDS